MKSRINSYQTAPGVMKAMMALQNEVAQSGLDPSLVGLVEIRASQINGCAFCLHMHTRDARARGETEQRIYLLDAWRESPLYSERERAALAWTEAVTLLSTPRVPDSLYEEVRQHFNEKEIADLTLAIVTINGWNRLTAAARTTPGTYQPSS